MEEGLAEKLGNSLQVGLRNGRLSSLVVYWKRGYMRGTGKWNRKIMRSSLSKRISFKSVCNIFIVHVLRNLSDTSEIYIAFAFVILLISYRYLFFIAI